MRSGMEAAGRADDSWEEAALSGGRSPAVLGKGTRPATVTC